MNSSMRVLAGVVLGLGGGLGVGYWVGQSRTSTRGDAPRESSADESPVLPSIGVPVNSRAYPDPALEVPRPVSIERGDPRYAEVDKWIEAAYGSDPKIQFSAANKLRRLGDPRSAGALIHILESSSMGVALARTAALLPLRAWRRLDAVPVLIEALDPAREDRDALPPDVVAVALDDITHRSAGASPAERSRLRLGGAESKRGWLAWWAENEQRLRKELGQER